MKLKRNRNDIKRQAKRNTNKGHPSTQKMRSTNKQASPSEIKEMMAERYGKLKENSLKIEGNWTC